MKRLSTRINHLEQHAGTNSELTPAAKNLLVEILARRDALFWPWRWTTTIQPPLTELRTRQREYLNAVVGITAKAIGRSNWKAAHELRQSLIASGHLTAVSSSGQIQSLFLTAKGEAVASAMIGPRLASADEVKTALEIVRFKISKYGSPIRESILFHLPCIGNPEDWQNRIELVLRLLTEGLLRCDSDTQGRILFALVDGVEFNESVAVDAVEESWADEVYLNSFNHERHVLGNASPRDGAEVYIPVGASDCWPKIKGDTDEK